MTDATHLGPLYTEHILLHAHFEIENETGPRKVLYYDNEADSSFVQHGALLIDLTGSTYLLAQGSSARSFAEAAFAGKKLTVGQAAFEATLTGDGALTSIPFLARCGDEEYVIVDCSARAETLDAWLGFLSHISQGDFNPYKDMKIEDATNMLVPLLLVGSAASHVLRDYIAPGTLLPQTNQIASLKLDSFATLIARMPIFSLDVPCFLILVPSHAVTRLWRSFLSFNEVNPAGCETLQHLIGEWLPWESLIATTQKIYPARIQLCTWKLIRDEADFVGARSLNNSAPEDN